MLRPSLSTRTGDTGDSGLFGGRRVSKASARLHAYGTVDELNAIVGLVLTEDLPPAIASDLRSIQRTLFSIGADLATPLDGPLPVDRLQESAVQALELSGVRIEADLPRLTHFILPGGCRAGALLHQARTVCRRAERWIVALAADEQINPQALIYVNRLSDYFFLASRAANKVAGVGEQEWKCEQR